MQKVSYDVRNTFIKISRVKYSNFANLCIFHILASNSHYFPLRISFQLGRFKLKSFQISSTNFASKRSHEHFTMIVGANTMLHVAGYAKSWDSSGNARRTEEKIRVPRISGKVRDVHAISWEIEAWPKREDRGLEIMRTINRSLSRHWQLYRSFDALFPRGIYGGDWILSSLMKELRCRGSLIRYSDGINHWTKKKLDRVSETTCSIFSRKARYHSLEDFVSCIACSLCLLDKLYCLMVTEFKKLLYCKQKAWSIKYCNIHDCLYFTKL